MTQFTRDDFFVGERVRITNAAGEFEFVISAASNTLVEAATGWRARRGVSRPWDVYAGPGVWEIAPITSVEYLDRPAPADEQPAPADEQAALRSDLTAIAEALRSEAIDRGWCDEYDDFVQKVNQRLSAPHLLTRTPPAISYKVSFVVTLPAGDDEPYMEEAVRDMFTRLINAAPESVKGLFALSDYEIEPVAR